MRHGIGTRIAGLALALAIVGYCASYALADQLTSTNFTFDENGFIPLGGFSSSTNFSILGSIDSLGNGESTSTSYDAGAGYLYPAESSPLTSNNWQWFDDSFDSTPSLQLASENVAPSGVAYNDPIKLRVTVRNAGADDVPNLKLRLQYATTSDFSAGAAYVGEQGTCASEIWCYADGAGTDNTVISETVLSDPDFCSGGIGTGCGTYNESGTSSATYLLSAGKKAEFDFTVTQQNGTEGVVYFFRLVDASTGLPVPTDSGKTYPSLMISGGTFTFTVTGLTSGTSTEGVTTDIATSPTGVSFGSLPLNSAMIAAHRLIVNTSATSGYKIYAYQRQGLLSDTASEIPPIDSTNSAPAGWSSACSATSTGCYGYHVGEDVLEGGSTRFAADDSYAKFTSSPDEVAYGSGPVSDASTDIVYKILVRDLQTAGNYASTIVYIATPVF